MVTFTGDSLRKLVKDDTDPEQQEAVKEIDHINFLEFADLEKSVRDDVEFLKGNPLVMKGTKISGWIHDVDSGEVRSTTRDSKRF